MRFVNGRMAADRAGKVGVVAVNEPNPSEECPYI